tara:strand:+ start:2072 stop:3307 length:1236 start_codon:yes stop_codon:yes gene_type:complete
MKKFIHGLLVVALILLSTHTAAAQSSEDESRLQLLAIIDYLERTYLEPTSLTNDDMTDIISDSVEWIVSAQKENGSFSYEYRPFEDAFSADNNQVRQAGTFYSLAEVYRYQTEKDAAIASAIAAAVDYFEGVSVRGEGERGDFLCIKNSRSSTRCELGTTALTLLGILSYLATEPIDSAEYESLAGDYLAYILEARLADRGFSNKYHVNDSFADTESSFYNGESMLALVRYYQYDPQPEIKQTFAEVFTYLAAAEVFETPLYLWMTAALKDAQKLWPNDEYLEYTAEFTNQRLYSERYKRNSGKNYCAPLEGLVSAASVLEDSSDEVLKEKLEEAVDFWLAKVAQLQLHKDNPYRLVKQDGVLQLLKVNDRDQAHGGFLTSEVELKQRIDFTQHCVSVYLQKQVDIDGVSI